MTMLPRCSDAGGFFRCSVVIAMTTMALHCHRCYNNNNGDAGGYGGINTTADNGDDNEDGTVVVNEDRNGPEYCNVCHDDTCVWLQHFEKISEYDRVLHSELSDKEKPSPNECRSHLYSQMAHHLWGALGRGNRKPLPDCVVTEILNLHPSPNGNYMGHMEEWDIWRSETYEIYIFIVRNQNK